MPKLSTMNDDLYFGIRFATAADALALARLHVETFNETHGDSPPLHVREQQWTALLNQQSDDEFVLLVANDQQQLAGFARGRPYDHENPAIEGELNKIYLLRRYQSKGLGRRLLCRAANEFVKRDMHSMLLFGDAHNPSNGFYEHLGGERLYASNGEFHGGYAWKDLKLLTMQCKDL